MRDKAELMYKWGSFLSLSIWIWIIFSASGQTGSESGQLSLLMMELLNKIGIRPQIWIPSVNWQLVIRKAAHFSIYFIMGILIYKNLMDNHRNRVARGIIILIFGIILASMDEYHQSLVPGREPSVYDVMIDSCGVLTGLCLIFNIDLHRIHGDLRTGSLTMT